MTTKKKSFNSELDDLLAGLKLPSDEDIKRDTTSLKISENNRRTWANPNVSNKRSSSIKQAKKDAGACPTELYEEIYLNSFGSDRRDGYVDTARKFLKSKGFDFHKDRVYHIINNGLNTVDVETHEQNISKWEKTFGFGVWEITSPGVDLLEEYDIVWGDNKFPPSVIYHIRFNMSTCSPKEIRDYLLPWTNGDYIRSSDGSKVENGRYINLRKKQYPFLTDKSSITISISDRDEMCDWLKKKMKRKSLTIGYMWQILNQGTDIKQVGELQGWLIRKL